MDEDFLESVHGVTDSDDNEVPCSLSHTINQDDLAAEVAVIVGHGAVEPFYMNKQAWEEFKSIGDAALARGEYQIEKAK